MCDRSKASLHQYHGRPCLAFGTACHTPGVRHELSIKAWHFWGRTALATGAGLLSLIGCQDAAMRMMKNSMRMKNWP